MAADAGVVTVVRVRLTLTADNRRQNVCSADCWTKGDAGSQAGAREGEEETVYGRTLLFLKMCEIDKTENLLLCHT